MKILRLPYNRKLRKRAQYLRKNSTNGEIRLWRYLKRKQFGVDFNRQKIILNYIVDFYCITLMLALEVDGSSHDEKKYNYDLKRQTDLENLGICVLRFTESDVMNRLGDVLMTIELKISELITPRLDYAKASSSHPS